ncbi:MAG TPA: UDP-3-O-(3-hydroxymyristoyl)glucosamine N-acyltransferase [Caulobacteraceae bacterium]|nr:UDP-3-O-(3-hydroxymyristoyl)glucosamine N-acyltransferase [Caulobacteraceae bacterium]
MPDRRFFAFAGPLSLAELSRLTEAELASETAAGKNIEAAASLERAGAGDVAFCDGPAYSSQLALTGAGAVFVRNDEAENAPAGCAALISRWPQVSFAIAARRLHPPLAHAGSAFVHPSAEIEEGVTIGPGVVIGQGARIGAGSVLSAGSVVGPGVAMGRDSYLGANAVIGFTLAGDGVRIYAGAVVGEAGFGAAPGPRGVVDIPQLGRVILQDNVTLGAGACVDRGALEDTVIGENTKIDNLVQIGHNVVIGRNCVMAAHTGISGSVVVGDGCMFGGRAGLADHIRIGAGARLAAGAGVSKDVPAGETWAGYPARPVARWRREHAWLSLRAARRRRGDEG